jgi:hypothetical protein
LEIVQSGGNWFSRVHKGCDLYQNKKTAQWIEQAVVSPAIIEETFYMAMQQFNHENS